MSARGGGPFGSTIAAKAVMAVTGIILVAYILGHVAGNLLIYRGPAAINGYGALLHRSMTLLWGVRILLLVAVILHIVSAVWLTRRSHAARTTGYARREPQASTIASRTMRWGGLVILLFVVYHVLHLTTGTLHGASFAEGDVYGNVVSAFRVWWVSAIYIVAMVFLGLHLYHGIWSSGKTLGVQRATGHPFRRRVATVLAVAVWLGFTSIPVAVLAGFIR
ncbi:MAG TPA: succinate dehydrogenase cytochrome b subunit [Gemmatimonadaceae bacterium]|nr:succinate dehydrogenase cytochrome b subunit [Gemmatimonadaceae bacterium]